MQEITIDLILIAVLVLANAAFAGSELAVVSLRQSQLRRLRREHGAAGNRVADLAAEPSRFLSTVQVGITLGGFLASATAAVSLAEPLERRLDALGAAAAPTSVVIVTIILTFITLVFGELVPKRIAMQRAEAWSLRAAGPLMRLAAVAKPAVWLLTKTTDAVAGLFGIRGHAVDQLSADELRDLITHGSAVAPARRAMLVSAIELENRKAREIMVPRSRLTDVRSDQPVSEAILVLVASGHSRAPVLVDDSYTRVVHLRDLAAVSDANEPVGELGRPAPIVPENADVLDVLKLLQTRRQQLALVADEYGSIAGIVTVEDVMEEVVGEIYDEFDRGINDDDDERAVTRGADGSLTLPGRFPLHDLAGIGVILPPSNTSHSTLAGVVLDHLERVPEPGDSAILGDWEVTVLAVKQNAITKIRLAPRGDR